MPQPLTGHYACWGVTPGQFPKNASLQEQLRFLLGFAILAPSTHNTQPWQFRITGSMVTFYLEPSRVLPASDPAGREAYVSMGCTLENFLIALAGFGFKAAVHYKDDLSLAPGTQKAPMVVCTVSVEIGGEPRDEDKRLCEALPQRRSSRVPYGDDLPDASLQTQLTSVVLPEVKLVLLQTSEQKKHAAEAVAAGSIIAFKNSAFGKELSHWIKHNWTSEPDGMPGFTVGMPGPVSLIAPKVLGMVNMGKMQAKMMREVVEASPLLGVVCGLDNPANWLSAGRLAERAAIMLTSHGFGTSWFGAPVEFDEVALPLQRALGLPARPLVFFRIGKPTKDVPFAPRRSVSSCML